ncbi:dihydrofolate reductase family protein [Chitinophaga sp. 22321]|uniref:Dihydrofolate reductase n=1 Tax=Chitinophaga hostae TaxID=2831022 RepID=A0ABS5IZA0_9BACT|nr:dihydrofolate reductase family protein [Chitinophaga hostae]MBS0027507.1 dihydrofolate reductase [Chitinophaga hostae]
MKITIYMATSANSLTSNERNDPFWLSQEYGQGFMQIAQQTKAVIMGKKTYNILAPDYLPLKDEGTLAVLTHDTNAAPANEAVVFTDKTPPEIVAMLEGRGHREAVIIGGTATTTAFMQAGLVDDIILVIEPILFGGGLPLFNPADFEYPLHLREVTKLNDNTIRVHYSIAK